MNLEQITKLFQPQLDKTKPECGDFLRGLSLEEAKSNFLNNQKMTQGVFDIDTYFARHVENSQKHIGQTQLFYMFETFDPIETHAGKNIKNILLSVVKIWSGDLDTLLDLRHIPRSHGSLPRFGPKK
jgi:hypothetical protein